jgi:hypothetical protein
MFVVIAQPHGCLQRKVSGEDSTPWGRKVVEGHIPIFFLSRCVQYVKKRDLVINNALLPIGV